eukprot:gene7967-16309_t
MLFHRLNSTVLRTRIELRRFLTDYPQLTGKLRTASDQGSRKSRELRKSGLIPGVVYGVDEDRNIVKFAITTPISEIRKELRIKGRSVENTLYNIVLDNGSTHLVTPRQIQLNPLTEEPFSVNFLKYWPGNTMKIPFQFLNEEMSVDLKRGCFLVYVNTFVECVCDGDIPQYINVDVSGIKKADVIRLSSVTLPPGVRPTKSVSSDM